MKATITSCQVDMAKRKKIVQIYMPASSSDTRDKDIETVSSIFNFIE